MKTIIFDNFDLNRIWRKQLTDSFWSQENWSWKPFNSADVLCVQQLKTSYMQTNAVLNFFQVDIMSDLKSCFGPQNIGVENFLIQISGVQLKIIS